MATKTKKKVVAKIEKKKDLPEVFDPRKIAFLSYYTDPKSETFSNALQSALKAGYSQEYSESITSHMPDWLSESLGKERRIKMAEKHMDEVLDLPIVTQAMGAFGPIFSKEEKIVRVKNKKGKFVNKKTVIKTPVMVANTSIIKEKSKVMEFTLSSLKRAEYGKQNGGPKVGFTFNLPGMKARYEI